MALNKCKSCGNMVADTARRCPHCGAYLWTGGRIGCAIILIIVFLPIIYQCFEKSFNSPNASKLTESTPPLTSETPPPSSTPIIKPYSCKDYTLNSREQRVFDAFILDRFDGWYGWLITSDTLQSDYDSNEVAGDQKYRGKTLLISGEVTSINRGIGENYYISLRGGSNMFSGPQARMADGFVNYLANLQKGQTVQLVCQGNGMLMGSAMLNECIPTSIFVKNQLSTWVADRSEECSKSGHGAYLEFWSSRVVASVLPDTSDCFATGSYNHNKCMTEINNIINDENMYEAASDKLQKSLRKSNSILKTVKLIGVPNSNSSVKIIRQYGNFKQEEDTTWFKVAKFDINNDGKEDILYTYRNYSGSCGYTWAILINKGNGKYEKNKCGIGCTGLTLDFSNETIEGLRIPYNTRGEKEDYGCKDYY